MEQEEEKGNLGFCQWGHWRLGGTDRPWEDRVITKLELGFGVSSSAPPFSESETLTFFLSEVNLRFFFFFNFSKFDN